VLFSCGFEQPPISDFIESYYGRNPSLLSPAAYELVRCTNCTIVYQRYVGDERLLKDIYGSWTNHRNRSFEEKYYNDDIKYFLESRDGHELLLVAAFLGVNLGNMVTLDYGTGWGGWARVAAKLGCQSYAFDISEPRVEFVRSKGITILSAEEILEHRFHFINTEQVLEHVTDPGTVVSELSNALLPGGVIKISVPSAENLDGLLTSLRCRTWNGNADSIMPAHPLEHVNGFTKRSLEFLARLNLLETVTPSWRQRYAFLSHPGAVNLRRPRKMLKELARPIYQYVNQRNLYVWLRKPCTSEHRGKPLIGL
jgi:2-polyprenyl-3-methyl-5-hydroxy-6-metoxy-1,4-benzoquinol methylase